MTNFRGGVFGATTALALSLFTTAAAAQGVPSPGTDAARAPDPAPPPAPAATHPPMGTVSPSPVPPPSNTAGSWGAQYPTRPWLLPAIEVPGEKQPELREEELIGNYAQPRWTAQRRFPTTRLYVIPAGKAEAEYWMRYTMPTKDPTKRREVRSYYEMGFGLGHRLQLDIYLVTQQEGHGEESRIELKREQLEVRYALADWGKLWGNPTLYLEYQRRNADTDWIEPKILLGGQVAPGWHAGFNLVLERQLGGKGEHEYNLTGGLSRTIVDRMFHIGVEGYAETHDVKKERFKFAKAERLFVAGPSFLVQPIAPMHILFSPLIGKGSGGEDNTETVVRLWLVTGWTF